MSRALLAAALWIVACSPAADRSVAHAPVDATARPTAAAVTAEAAPALAPKPCTLDELRAGCPAGRVIEHRIVEAGKAPRVERVVFVAVDEAGAELEATTFDERGNVVEGPSRAKAKWPELHDHASFPADRTTISEEAVTVPAGTFECKLYVVRKDDGIEQRLHFAQNLPGPPVRMVLVKGGETLLEMTLVKNELP
jgi:hypothetical protein